MLTYEQTQNYINALKGTSKLNPHYATINALLKLIEAYGVDFEGMYVDRNDNIIQARKLATILEWYVKIDKVEGVLTNKTKWYVRRFGIPKDMSKDLILKAQQLDTSRAEDVSL